MQHLVAVIDIGKTNKKVSLYGPDLRRLASVSTSMPARMENGVLIEPVADIMSWLGQQLAELYRKHPYQAISISTHGATTAWLDAQGQAVLPVIAYDQPVNDADYAELVADFTAQCGPLDQVQADTGTCLLPLLINPAIAWRWAQRKFPSEMARVTSLLNYPQYLGYLLTGQMAAEPTYTANHAYFYDYTTGKPSRVAQALGAESGLDLPLQKSWKTLGTLLPQHQAAWGLPALPLTIGIHDSNAALLPYLVAYPGEDFVVNSTGTWCVAMHRVGQYGYGPGELGQTIIFNIDALGGMQKVSFLMGGQDYGLYHGLIGGVDAPFDPARINAALERATASGDVLLPGYHASLFPAWHGGATSGGTVCTVEDIRAGRKPAWFAETTYAHDLLNVSLALQSEIALRRTGVTASTAVFVEGGFRNNHCYLAALGTRFPGRVELTSLAEATSAGAALLGHALLQNCSPADLKAAVQIERGPLPLAALPALARYAQAWGSIVGA